MKKTIPLIFIFTLLPFFVDAATVAVEIDTGSELINAVSGTLVLPPGSSVGDIYTGSSAILIWVAQPTYNSEANTVTFAGLSPGGFKGKYPLFSLEWQGGNIGQISFKDVNSYRNDGEGTPANVRLFLSETKIADDLVPPEPFTPVISTSPDIFEGRAFVSFVAQDKGTGIEKYEYAATWFFAPGENGKWITAESPLVLSNSERFKRIHVRAIDGQGNFRVVSTAGPYSYISLGIGLIMMVCVALFITRSLRSYS
jgi:hypothetical protein